MHRVRPERPSRAWYVALAALSLFFVAMVFFASLIGPFIIGAVPFMAMVGLAFGPIWERCRAEPSCPRCSRILAYAPTEREATRARRALRTQTA